MLQCLTENRRLDWFSERLGKRKKNPQDSPTVVRHKPGDAICQPMRLSRRASKGRRNVDYQLGTVTNISTCLKSLSKIPKRCELHHIRLQVWHVIFKSIARNNFGDAPRGVLQMSLPGFYWWQLDWENEDGESKASTSPPKTIEIPPNKQVRAHAMLAAVGSQNKHQGFGANCYISRYVQNGVVHDVTARLVDQPVTHRDRSHARCVAGERHRDRLRRSRVI